MTYTVEKFAEHLFDKLGLNSQKNFYVAFSGGKDSTALLHLLVSIRKQYGFSLTALHVNHNLNDDSNNWVKHCKQVCSQMGVEIKQASVNLSDRSELNARIARYRWFREQIERDSYLFTGHHGDDRAETLLFNLMRGSGSRGLSSLRSVTPFYGSKLVRPLLNMSQQQVSEYIDAHKLSWVDDPSNEELYYMRNRIRHQVLPAMTEFRPDAIQNIVRAANNLEQENNLLREIAIADLVEVREHAKHPIDNSYAICYKDFVHMSVARQSNLVRFWLQSLNLHTPSKRLLDALLNTFVSNPSSTMQLQESGSQFRFYRGYMYVMPAFDDVEVMPIIDWQNIDQPIDLFERKIRVGATNKLIDLLRKQNSSLVRLSSRPHIVNPKALQGHSLNLKKWLHEAGIPPWRRQSVPLLTIRDTDSDLVLSPIDQQLSNDWVSFESTSTH